jgi:hypothetical protein
MAHGWDSLSCPILICSSRLKSQNNLTQFPCHFYNSSEHDRLILIATLIDSLKVVFFSLPAYGLGLLAHAKTQNPSIIHLCQEIL